jgi:hypothetical protein
MVERYEAMAMGWWKCDRYTVHNGYVQPIARAKPEPYDPWELFWATRSDARGIRQPKRRIRFDLETMESNWEHPPYATLAGIARAVVEARGLPTTAEIVSLDEAAKRQRLDAVLSEAEAVQGSRKLKSAITSWCARYGLLGVLPHRANAVTFDRQRKSQDGPPRKPKRGFYRGRYLRTTTGWRSEWTLASGKADTTWPSPSVDIQPRLDSAVFERRPLVPTWTQYFPRVSVKKPTPDAFPLPTDPAFWERYAEPLPQFLEGADKVLEAMELMVSDKPQDGWLRTLNSLLSPAAVALVRTKGGGFRQQWFSPSLLTTLALMLAQDLNNGGRVRQCVACQHVFVSRAHQATCCSEQCRKLTQKRRGRAKKKGKSKRDKRSPKRRSKGAR